MRFCRRIVNRKLGIAIAAAALGLGAFAPSAFAQLTAKANHDNIQINLGYHGSTVSVSGSCDPNVDLVIDITHSGDPETLSREDRVAGTVWMNVEKIKFDKIPSLYFIRSTKDLTQLLGQKDLADNSIGYEALAANAKLSPDPTPEIKKSLFDEYIKFKEAGAIYGNSVGSIDLKTGDDGNPSYYTLFDWPYQAPPGHYDVNVYEVRDQQIVATATSGVEVGEGGIVQTLDDMSTQNSALYGSAAVLVALIAGFGVGLVFKGGGAH